MGSKPDKPKRRPRILVVDDRDDYLRSLRNALAGEFDVVTAGTLAAAQLAMDETVSVALVDVRLSENDFSNRDGVRFLEWSKARFPSVPVIMMSAYMDFDAVVESLNLGADYYLRKPINPRELRERLQEFADKGIQPARTAELRQRMQEEHR